MNESAWLCFTLTMIVPFLHYPLSSPPQTPYWNCLPNSSSESIFHDLPEPVFSSYQMIILLLIGILSSLMTRILYSSEAIWWRLLCRSISTMVIGLRGTLWRSLSVTTFATTERRVWAILVGVTIPSRFWMGVEYVSRPFLWCFLEFLFWLWTKTLLNNNVDIVIVSL